ncbi:nuclear transport factor 2 family protein [Nonomuraea sp. 3-1Str]|uniref:YybH family protein n=1 Tax=Nonomuraea sp. 3-1Str TaxID=2929801 RepID=UPI002867722F|nr:nuclear transport factor 2 family protein [Nonomuraea sp. 3-1Str]MDR8408926.1 nuclear transport factor 2 family protein [Nonomuraea sp. 3-1Str]
MSADRRSLLDHDQRFFEALTAAEVKVLDDLLADDFVLVSVEDGAAVGRDVLLDAIATGAVRFPAIESFPDEAIVRRIGDVGIVVGRTGMNFTRPDGTAFSAGSRYTHVYVAVSPGLWRLVSAQGTAIKPPA